MGASDGAGGVLLPFIRDHYGVDKGTISFIFLAGSLGYLLSAFNSGPLVGKLGYRIFLMGANDGAGGVLLPFIRAHYGVDNGTISFIFLAGSLGYLLSAFN